MSRPRKTSGRLRGSQALAKISHMVGIIWLGQGRPLSYRRPSGAQVVGISDQRRPLAQFENGTPLLRPPEGPRATIYVVCWGRSVNGEALSHL